MKNAPETLLYLYKVQHWTGVTLESHERAE